MSLIAATLGRLGSRYSIIFDPIRKKVIYGSLGLLCQTDCEMIIGLEDKNGEMELLPLTQSADSEFLTIDQSITMTSICYEAFSEKFGVLLSVEFVAPFWPQDEKTSSVPGYIVNIDLKKLASIRGRVCKDAIRVGKVVFGLRIPNVTAEQGRDGLCFRCPVKLFETPRVSADGFELGLKGEREQTPLSGNSEDMIFGIEGPWQVEAGLLKADFDIENTGKVSFCVGLASYCSDALFERFGKAMPLKYTRIWDTVKDVAKYIKEGKDGLLKKSRAFNALWENSPMPLDMQKVTAYSFQSYLMNTLWAIEPDGGEDWFSVWEGCCVYNSTIDVTYNEAMFYFSCWPELLEKIFEQWTHHANNPETEKERMASSPKNHAVKSLTPEELEFDGVVLEHDMGAAWTANGQSYPHAMPVEENSNYLILLYAHGCWWGKKELFEKYLALIKKVTDYLFWSDSTGNGFPDRGRANTFDDSSPAFQYGRDNVYLGIKRLAALHSAGRMFEYTGEEELAKKCFAEVKKAVKSLNASYLSDHFPVVLDKSSKGLMNCRTGEPLEGEVLQGWDDYSIYNSNGLLYLMMIDDMPAGLKQTLLKEDIVNATRETMIRYGSAHSSRDNVECVWISVNIWRDCMAGYLGEDMLENGSRYWDLQLSSNDQGSDKANCFTESLATGGLFLYPRGITSFGLMLSTAGIVINRLENKHKFKPIRKGQWPILPDCNWKKNEICIRGSLKDS
ncbi:MAG: DUF4965 domain-containing protein [Anaerohalosphaeraceae bacterium]|nr:DUF4965 domain-containing protein [Anaerohalosphaeraceae bacterium]